LLHHPCRCLAHFAVEQALQGFEKRQIGLGPGEALRTAPARQGAEAAGGRQLAVEVFDQGRLADAGLAGHAQEQPVTSRRQVEGATQLREFFLATHGMTLDGGNRWTCRPAWLWTGQPGYRPDREDPAQVRGEVPCGGIAILLALRQRLEARPFHLGRDVADELSG